MEKKSKIKVIVDAFTSEKPIEESWYKERLEICKGCEYNTQNNPPKDLLNKFRKVVDGGKPHCLACGCYIAEKAAMKEEECGLSVLDMAPKWNALAVMTASPEDLDIFNNSPEKVTVGLSENKEFFVVEYGDITKSFDTKINLVLSGECKITDVDVSCGCTQPEIKELSPSLYEMKVSLSLRKIEGAFRKNIFVSYFTKTNKKMRATIQLRGTVKHV
jgi:hypothetical protein